MSNSPAHVKSSRQRLLKAGGKRLPTGYLQPDAAAALAALQARHDWPNTATGCISRAIIQAAGEDHARQD